MGGSEAKEKTLNKYGWNTVNKKIITLNKSTSKKNTLDTNREAPQAWLEAGTDLKLSAVWLYVGWQINPEPGGKNREDLSPSVFRLEGGHWGKLLRMTPVNWQQNVELLDLQHTWSMKSFKNKM